MNRQSYVKVFLRFKVNSRIMWKTEELLLQYAEDISFLENIIRQMPGMIEGLNLVDIYTEQEEGRLIDNIVLDSDLVDMPVVGFENHGGKNIPQWK